MAKRGLWQIRFPSGNSQQEPSSYAKRVLITFLAVAGIGLPAWAIHRGQNVINIDSTSLILKALILLQKDKSQEKDKEQPKSKSH